MKNKNILYIFIFWALLCFSCQKEDAICSSAISQNISLKFSKMYHIKSSTGLDTVLYADSIMYISNVSVKGTDTLFLKGDSATVFKNRLPLNPLADTTFYVISSALSAKDIPVTFPMAVTYKRMAQVVSPACGVKTSFTDFSVLPQSTTPYDSIVFKNIAGDNLMIEIYYETFIPVRKTPIVTRPTI